MKSFFLIFFLFLELLILFFINFYLISLFISVFFGSPYVPTKRDVVDKILKKIKPKKGQLFYELGCGDGLLIKKAVKQYQVYGVGIDINPFFILYLKLSSMIRGRTNPKFIHQDILKADLKNADYIYCFMMPNLLEKLRKKFDYELKENTIVISHGFKIPNWDKNLYYVLQGKPFNTYFYKKR